MFSNIFYEFWSQDNTVWPILSFQGSFIKFHQNLIFHFCFKHLLKILNQGQYGLTHTVPLEKFDQLLLEIYIIWCTLHFSYTAGKFWTRDNTVWPIMSFQGTYRFYVQGSYTNFHLKHRYPLYHEQYSFKFSLKTHIFFSFSKICEKLKLGHYDLANIVLPSILYKFPPKAHIILVFKNLLKGTIRFDPCMASF